MDSNKVSANEGVVVSKIAHPSSNRLRKRYLFAICGVVVVAVGIGVALLVIHYHHHSSAQKLVASTVCSSGADARILSQSAVYFAPGYASQLAPFVAKIEKRPDYEGDPNCLYVLATYYSNIADPNDAQKYINLFNELYNSNKGLSPYLINTPSMQTIQAIVSQQTKIQQQLEKEFKQEKAPIRP